MQMNFDLTPEQELILAIERIQEDVGEIKSEQKLQGNLLTGNGDPKKGIVYRLEHLEDLVGSLLTEMKLYAERRVAVQSTAVNWNRLTFEISKGIGIAVGSTIVLALFGFLVLGIRISLATPGVIP